MINDFQMLVNKFHRIVRNYLKSKAKQKIYILVLRIVKSVDSDKKSMYLS